MAVENEPGPFNSEQIAATTDMVKLIRPDLSDEVAGKVAEAVIPSASEAARTRTFDEERIVTARKRVAEVIATAESEDRQE